MQKNLDVLEESANKSLVMYKHKCGVWHVGKHNLGVQHGLGSTWLGISLKEMNLRDLVDSKLHTSGQCAAVSKKGYRMLGCINMSITSRDKVIIPLYLTVVRSHLCSVLVPAVQ